MRNLADFRRKERTAERARLGEARFSGRLSTPCRVASPRGRQRSNKRDRAATCQTRRDLRPVRPSSPSPLRRAAETRLANGQNLWPEQRVLSEFMNDARPYGRHESPPPPARSNSVARSSGAPGTSGYFPASKPSSVGAILPGQNSVEPDQRPRCASPTGGASPSAPPAACAPANSLRHCKSWLGDLDSNQD